MAVLTLADLRLIEAALAAKLKTLRGRRGYHGGVAKWDARQGRTDFARRSQDKVHAITLDEAATQGTLARVREQIADEESRQAAMPDVSLAMVSCGGMVMPNPLEWNKILGYTTPSGFHVYHHSPSDTVWKWNTDIRRMSRLTEDDEYNARHMLRVWASKLRTKDEEE